MKKYTTQQLDQRYIGNIKSFDQNNSTYYLDKLENNEYAVCWDEKCLGVFTSYMEALYFYKTKTGGTK